MGTSYAVAATSDRELNTLSTPRISLEVHVLDAVTLAFVDDAEVLISGPVAAKGTTDPQGVVTFADLPAGSYVVWAERADYLMEKAEVEIPAQPKQPFAVATVLLTPIVIEIVDGAGAALTAPTKTVVGKKVALAVRSKPAGHTLTHIEWVIPEERVKNYVQSETQGVVFKLDAADLGKASIEFFWISGGSKSVRVVARIGGRQREATASFEVEAPTDITLDSRTGQVGVGPVSDRSGIWLHYGGTANTPGIIWTFTATAPPGFGGKIVGVQLVKRTILSVSNNGRIEVTGTSGGFWLDVSFPYGEPKFVSPSKTAIWRDHDSPKAEVQATDVMLRIDDEFKMYFMFKPSGRDSIWVTLGRLDWHWKATTKPTPSAGAWPPPTDVDANAHPSGSTTTELPVWSKRLKNWNEP